LRATHTYPDTYPRSAATLWKTPLGLVGHNPPALVTDPISQSYRFPRSVRLCLRMRAGSIAQNRRVVLDRNITAPKTRVLAIAIRDQTSNFTGFLTFEASSLPSTPAERLARGTHIYFGGHLISTPASLWPQHNEPPSTTLRTQRWVCQRDFFPLLLSSLGVDLNPTTYAWIQAPRNIPRTDLFCDWQVITQAVHDAITRDGLPFSLNRTGWLNIPRDVRSADDLRGDIDFRVYRINFQTGTIYWTVVPELTVTTPFPWPKRDQRTLRAPDNNPLWIPAPRLLLNDRVIQFSTGHPLSPATLVAGLDPDPEQDLT
jgi:hypothetical protein